MPRVAIVVLLVLAPTAALLADWRLFRGNPQQTGVADVALPEKLDILWKVQLKDGVEGTAAIAGDTVYVGAIGEFLYALDLRTGAEKWKYKAGPITSPASYHDGAVYIGDEDGIFHCVDASSGKKRWSFETNGEISSGANFSDDKIIFTGKDSMLYCLDSKGKLVWKFKTEGPVYGSATVAGGMTFVAGCDSHLHIVDLKTGKEAAKISLEGQAGSTPAAAGDRLFVGTMSNQFLAIDLKKKDIAWIYEPARAQGFYSSPAVTDKLILVGCRDRALHALDRVKGTKVWTFLTRGHVDSSPVVAGKNVLFGSKDGHLYVVDIEKGAEVQKLALGRSIIASPAVSNGRVVIGATDGLLYCLGKKE
ncbi:MAG: serine/threonine protein kinase [Planctomycetes bacterium]|nr:serine/threonine protein kinase [Planctomycetota bacterium]